jgi:hypothetical protein
MIENRIGKVGKFRGNPDRVTLIARTHWHLRRPRPRGQAAVTYLKATSRGTEETTEDNPDCQVRLESDLTTGLPVQSVSLSEPGGPGLRVPVTGPCDWPSTSRYRTSVLGWH